jgi:hypothetical protein
MFNINKGIEAVKKNIAGVDYMSLLKINEAVTIGMGPGQMDSTDTVTVKMESDIL